MVYWIVAAVLAGIGIALFVLPHHKGDYGFGSLARDFGEALNSQTGESPGILVMMVLVGLGAIGVFLPAILATVLALTSSETSRKVLIVGGIVSILASVLTFLVEIVSNMQIGWGSGSKYPETVVAYLAPLFPFLCGVTSIVMGAMRVRIP